MRCKLYMSMGAVVLTVYLFSAGVTVRAAVGTPAILFSVPLALKDLPAGVTPVVVCDVLNGRGKVLTTQRVSVSAKQRKVDVALSLGAGISPVDVKKYRCYLQAEKSDQRESVAKKATNPWARPKAGSKFVGQVSGVAHT